MTKTNQTIPTRAVDPQTDASQRADRQADIKKLAELIKDIRIAMLTTVDENGALRSRPMATQEMEEDFDGTVWFFTSDPSGKVGEIKRYQQVNLSYVSTDDDHYVSVIGNAEIVDDAAKMKALWKPVMKAWFPDGLDDPTLRLIKVNIDGAEYWESKGGKVGALLGVVKNLVTGTTGNEGKNEKMKLS